MTTPTSLKLRRASATLESYNQSPRKVRLVTDLVKGKRVEDALATLQFLPKRAAEPVAKLIKSAVANAKQGGEKVEDLKVQNITVEAAEILKRYMPRAFGRASLIRHRKSRVIVTLAPKA
ncbi:50S ribosomal protein L22 [Candidatus Kaiserbacteria bacterium RIFCSPLOWO2_12_FULL_52_8]|uniref:Large ribosomal subunit protein uL22 n=1 Tax=Candidatus Kaiserbacteria bacterium RIFCSPHIGHO2_01_FULL_53_31 TaxID=1798481 RepID=A0A1F6CHZ1_9BACT|nr:MAG: 50S ribosomal protein L22 [Candidatus Kaiserbacteria bacterium RIFCSPHIGHO2_01_FULL_53_31]OGG94386.1 MAG: 50S ribosomal protein L22 [Candidatus Kaiserbacteria bacterium RIFCSPLOWO2_12_FULL_52_8]